jgi:RHS repeat-associated protein
VTALTSAAGTLLGRYHYSPFGTLVSADAGLPAQPLKWTGRELDETGFYYLRARYYHPGWGRFISEDPAGLSAGLNVYLFAGNSPVGMRDPFGLKAGNQDDGDPANFRIPSRWGDTIRENAARNPWAGQALAGVRATTEFAAGFNPITDGAVTLNALGQGDYASAAFSAIPGPIGNGIGGLGRAAKGVQRIDPWAVRFTQDTVDWTFKNPRYNIGDSASQLRNDVNFDLEPIRIFQRGGNYYTLDNRRLLTYRAAGRSIPYVVVDPSSRSIAREIREKFTTRDDGMTVAIKKVPREFFP